MILIYHLLSLMTWHTDYGVVLLKLTLTKKSIIKINLF
jgi:hypothetical protein